MAITIESLKVVPYLKIEHLGDGRTVKLMPWCDGTKWRMWVDTPVGLIEGKMMDTIEGDYVGIGAAKESELFIPFASTQELEIGSPTSVRDSNAHAAGLVAF